MRGFASESFNGAAGLAFLREKEGFRDSETSNSFCSVPEISLQKALALEFGSGGLELIMERSSVLNEE